MDQTWWLFCFKNVFFIYVLRQSLKFKTKVKFMDFHQDQNKWRLWRWPVVEILLYLSRECDGTRPKTKMEIWSCELLFPSIHSIYRSLYFLSCSNCFNFACRVNPQKLGSIRKKLEAFCAQDLEIKQWAQKVTGHHIMWHSFCHL